MKNIHILRIDEIKHISENGKVLWQSSGLLNVIHVDGEEFMLSALFNGGNNPNTVIPDFYYFGLDDRTTVNTSDTMASLTGEPTLFGYQRQSVDSTTGFTIVEVSPNVLRALSTILSFSASGGTWGPIDNLFLTSKPDNTGFLIATVALGASITVTNGQSVTMRMSMGLEDTTC